jgi:hypothetical protein
MEKKLMRVRLSNVAVLVITVIMAAAVALGAPKTQSYTGQVSDSMCGAKHQMSDPAACTRACVKQGSKYALVVGDKVYTLQADEKNAAELDKLAGEKAKVNGTLEGDTIKVSSVSPGK